MGIISKALAEYRSDGDREKYFAAIAEANRRVRSFDGMQRVLRRAGQKGVEIAERQQDRQKALVQEVTESAMNAVTREAPYELLSKLEQFRCPADLILCERAYFTAIAALLDAAEEHFAIVRVCESQDQKHGFMVFVVGEDYFGLGQVITACLASVGCNQGDARLYSCDPPASYIRRAGFDFGCTEGTRLLPQIVTSLRQAFASAIELGEVSDLGETGDIYQFSVDLQSEGLQLRSPSAPIGSRERKDSVRRRRQQLERALCDEDAGAVADACARFPYLVPDSHFVIPELSSILGHRNELIRCIAARGIIDILEASPTARWRAIGPAVDDVCAVLEEIVFSADEKLTKQATNLLQRAEEVKVIIKEREINSTEEC